MNNNEISGALFDSVQILIDASLAKINYDKTLKYKIKNDNKKSEGIYTVTDGDIEFEAKATTTSEEYKIDDQVYVTITQGDYSQDKVIIGRYIESETNKPITYIAPEDQLILDYEQEFISDTVIGLIADSGWMTEERITGTDKTTIPPPEVKKVCFLSFNDYNNGHIENDYTRLILGCDFLNRLGNYNIVSGNYGITAGVITSEKPVNVNNPTVDIPSDISNAENLLAIQNYINNQTEEYENRFGINYITFDSSEMIGNIYNYNQAISQDVIVDISALQNIVGIFIEIYQKNNFSSQQLVEVIPLHEAYKKKYGLSSVEDFQKSMEEFYKMEANNISVQKVWLKFGYSQQSMEDNTFNLYTQNSLTFTPAATLIEENVKNIKAKWIHKDEKLGKLISINDLNTIEGYQDKYQVYWYTSSYEVGDTYAGWGWTRIKAEDKGMTGLTQSADPFDLIYAPVTDQSEISIKAVLLEKGENDSWSAKAQSSILTFKNKSMTSNVSGVVYLEITDSQKEFMFYRQDFKIDLYENFNKTRTIKATVPETRQYDTIEIQWIIPRGGTMIFDPAVQSSTGNSTIVTHPHYLKYDTNMNAVSVDGGNLSYYKIVRKFTKSQGEELPEDCFKQGFGVKEFYNPTYNRNQITCRVYYDNSYDYYDEGKINLVFGQMGSNGTNYNFGLQYKDDPYITCYVKKHSKIQSLTTYEYNKIKVKPFLTSDSMELSKELVDNVLAGCTYELQDPNTTGISVPQNQGQNEYIEIGVLTEGIDPSLLMSNCIKATCVINDITLHSYLPIAIRFVYQEYNEETGKYESITDPTGIQAPGLINYSSQGSKIEYSTAPLYLFGNIADSNQIIGTQNQTLDLIKGPQSAISWNIQEGLVNDTGYVFTKELQENSDQNNTLYTDYDNSNANTRGFLFYFNLTKEQAKQLTIKNKYTFISEDTNWPSGNNKLTAEFYYVGDNYFYLYNILECTTSWTGIPRNNADTNYTVWHGGKELFKVTIYERDSKSKNDSASFKAGPYVVVSSRSDLDKRVYTKQNYLNNKGQGFILEKINQTPTSSTITLKPDGGNNTEWYKLIGGNSKYRCGKYLYYINLTEEYSRGELATDIQNKVKFINFTKDQEYLFPGSLTFISLESNNYRVRLNSKALSYSQNITNTQTSTTPTPFSKVLSNGDSAIRYNVSSYITQLLQANKDPWFVIKNKYEADDNDLGTSKFNCTIIPNLERETTNIWEKYLQSDLNGYYFDFHCSINQLPLQGYIYFPNFYKGIVLTEVEEAKDLPVSWGISQLQEGKKDTQSDKIGAPSIKNEENKDVYYLQPYPIYIQNQRMYQLEASYYSTTSEVNYLLWMQPLLILQDLYSNPILNKWDGQTNITDSHILSQAIGAGSKDSQNRFSGVFMGKVGVDDTKAQHGLYGFHNGAQSFGFRDNGTAFIGKPGAGRIEFDGNTGVITSSLFNLNQNDNSNLTPHRGIRIDLDNGQFDLRGQTNMSDTVYGDNPSGKIPNPYFWISHKRADGKIVWPFAYEPSVGHYWLRSISGGDYTSADNQYADFLLDLNNGRIQATNFLLTAGGEGTDAKIKSRTINYLDSSVSSGFDMDFNTGAIHAHIRSGANVAEGGITVQHYDHDTGKTSWPIVLNTNGNKEFLLQSIEYDNNDNPIMSIDLKRGKITGKKLHIEAGTNPYIQLTTEDNKSPLKIYYENPIGNVNTAVKWPSTEISWNAKLKVDNAEIGSIQCKNKTIKCENAMSTDFLKEGSYVFTERQLNTIRLSKGNDEVVEYYHVYLVQMEQLVNNPGSRPTFLDLRPAFEFGTGIEYYQRLIEAGGGAEGITNNVYYVRPKLYKTAGITNMPYLWGDAPVDTGYYFNASLGGGKYMSLEKNENGAHIGYYFKPLEGWTMSIHSRQGASMEVANIVEDKYYLYANWIESDWIYNQVSTNTEITNAAGNATAILSKIIGIEEIRNCLELGTNPDVLSDMISATCTTTASGDGLAGALGFNKKKITDYFRVDALGITHVTDLRIRKADGSEVSLWDYIKYVMNS